VVGGRACGLGGRAAHTRPFPHPVSPHTLHHGNQALMAARVSAPMRPLEAAKSAYAPYWTAGLRKEEGVEVRMGQRCRLALHATARAHHPLLPTHSVRPLPMAMPARGMAAVALLGDTLCAAIRAATAGT